MTRCFSMRNYCNLVPRFSALLFNGRKSRIQFRRQYRQNHPPIFNQLREMDRKYVSIKDKYKIKVPEYFNFANDFIDQWTEIDKSEGDKPLAFWFVYKNGQEVKWTYEELTQNTKKVANALKSLGAGTKWRRCLVILPKIPEWWLVNVACMRLGVVICPTTPQSTTKDIKYFLTSSKSECILTVLSFADAVDLIQPNCPKLSTKILVNTDGSSRSGWENFKHHYDNASDQHQCVRTKSSDIFQVFFTSGTGTLPKRVVRLNAELPLGLFMVARYLLQLDRRDIYWTMADTGWAKTLWGCLLTPWITGATAFVHEMSTIDHRLILNTLRNYPVDKICATPTVYRILAATGTPKFKSLKVCISTGEPMNPQVAKKWKDKTGITLLEFFGQTEIVGIIGTVPGQLAKPGSMGTKLPGMIIDIVDENGKALPIGEKGNIGIKIKPQQPLGVFKEYENDPAKNAKCVAGDYYLTGDIAYEDEDGFLWYDCRSDDLITSAGYRIGPFEVECALQEHPDVSESGVIGVADLQRTQSIKAYIVLKESGKKKDPYTLKRELQEHVKKVTAPYKYPREIEFVESLPKTPSGKLKRAELRERSRQNLTFTINYFYSMMLT